MQTMQVHSGNQIQMYGQHTGPVYRQPAQQNGQEMVQVTGQPVLPEDDVDNVLEHKPVIMYTPNVQNVQVGGDDQNNLVIGDEDNFDFEEKIDIQFSK